MFVVSSFGFLGSQRLGMIEYPLAFQLLDNICRETRHNKARRLRPRDHAKAIHWILDGLSLSVYSEGVTEISMLLLVGVLLVSAVESTGTRTLASGK